MPLNDTLFRRLRDTFGQVPLVTRVAEAMESHPEFDPEYAEVRLRITYQGEAYAINCPFCRDTRRRLYVNHRWGQPDGIPVLPKDGYPGNKAGRPLLNLTTCFNDKCMKDPDNRKMFRDRMMYRQGLTRCHVDQGNYVAEEDRVVIWPGKVTRVDRLDPDHKAVTYLQSRPGQFDPQVLGKLYGVSYCEHSDFYAAVSGRLVVPSYTGNDLKIWQARYCGDLDWKGKHKHVPKYFTSPGGKTSSHLGNLYQARFYDTIVLTEGWFDVFGVGPMGVCVFGKTVSRAQLDLLRELASQGKAIVLYLDPEVAGEKHGKEQLEWLQQELGKYRYLAVQPPDNTDPGSLSPEANKRWLTHHAAKAGIDLSFALSKGKQHAADRHEAGTARTQGTKAVVEQDRVSRMLSSRRTRSAAGRPKLPPSGD